MKNEQKEKDLTTQIENAREPLIYNSMVLENYVRMVKTRYPEIDVNEVLKKVKIEPWELADPAQWLTQRHYNDLYDELNRYFGEPREISLAREAGRFSSTGSSKKLMRETVYSFLSPTRAYDVFSDIAQRFSRAADYVTRRIGKNKHQVIITFKDGVRPQAFQCQNYWGYLEAIYFLFEKKWPKIEHPECHFRGDGHCKYNITWDYSIPQTLNRIRNYLITLTVIGSLPFLLLKFFKLTLGILVVSSLTCLSMSLLAEFLERRSFFNRVKQQRVSPKEKIEGYDRFYNFAQLFNEISRHLSKHTNISEVLEKLSQILKGLSYETGIIFIIDQQHDHALFSQPFGLDSHLSANMRSALQSTKIELNKIPPEFKKPMVIDQHDKLPDIFPKAFKDVLKELNELIFIPISYENSVLGFFIVQNKYSSRPLMASDINLLTTLASQTALSVLNIAAFEELLRNEQLKNEFVAIASHELRTPIQIILLALDEIQSTLSEPNRTDLADELQAMNESARRLEHIVKDILDINKLETRKSKIDLKKVGVQRLIDSVRIETGNLISSKGHTISYNPVNVDYLHCEPDLMVQTLTNLVNNAAKYTPPGGHLVMNFNKNDTDITIECIDNGIGIAKAYHEKVFMKFYQIDEASALDKSGCGLGLSLCNEIVKKHGGYITLESPLPPGDYPYIHLSQVRKGSKFSVHLKP